MWRVISGTCTCGVLHHVIVGDIPWGELRALRLRLQAERVILHYVDGDERMRCTCGVELRLADGGELQVVTESDR